jgi:TRAP-type C4-dicarboxylate transport system permease small subunit
MDPVKTPAPRGVLFYVGAAGLLCVMLIEVVAVIGRHTRLPLLGALEMAQAAIVPAACAAMVIAALAGAHAAVHLVTERLPPGARALAARVSALLAAVFFAGLCVGACWLTVEFWNSFEETDVLHIPFRPLRVLVAFAAGALAVIFLHRALRPRASA